MSRTLRTVVSVFALPATVGLLGACGARTDLIPVTDEAADGAADGSTAQSPSMSTPVGTPAGVPTQYASPQDACMASDGSSLSYASEGDLQSLIVGRWMLCNPGTPNAYWSAEGVGLDLLSDGLAYPLFRRDGAEIVRGGGAYVWRYSVVPVNGDAFDMVFEGGGNPTFHSTLEDNPRKLVMGDGHTQYTFAPAQ